MVHTESYQGIYFAISTNSILSYLFTTAPLPARKQRSAWQSTSSQPYLFIIIACLDRPHCITVYYIYHAVSNYKDIFD